MAGRPLAGQRDVITCKALLELSRLQGGTRKENSHESKQTKYFVVRCHWKDETNTKLNENDVTDEDVSC